MSYKFNVFTGTFDIVSTVAGGSTTDSIYGTSTYDGTGVYS